MSQRKNQKSSQKRPLEDPPQTKNKKSKSDNECLLPKKKIVDVLTAYQLNLKSYQAVDSNEAFLTHEYCNAFVQLKDYLDAVDVQIHFPALFEYNFRLVSF